MVQKVLPFTFFEIKLIVASYPNSIFDFFGLLFTRNKEKEKFRIFKLIGWRIE